MFPTELRPVAVVDKTRRDLLQDDDAPIPGSHDPCTAECDTGKCLIFNF